MVKNYSENYSGVLKRLNMKITNKTKRKQGGTQSTVANLHLALNSGD